MAKKKDGTPTIEEMKDMAFKGGLKKLTQEQLDIMEELGIKNFDDLFGMLAAFGGDMGALDDMLSGKEEIPESEEEFTKRILGDSAFSDDYDPDNFGGIFDNITRVLHDVEPKEMHLRIKLNNAPVPVWREIKVPSNLSLEALAELLVNLMGWEDTHLHQFRKKDVLFKSPRNLEQESEFGFPSRHLSHDANDFHLGNIFQEKGDRVKFEYDFGDSWEHDVWLKGIRDYAPGEEPQAIVVKGEGACPPEDCGGVWGYAQLLDTLAKKRKTKEEKERLDWYGLDRTFDPNDYDKKEENDFIAEIWDDLMDNHEKLNR